MRDDPCVLGSDSIKPIFAVKCQTRRKFKVETKHAREAFLCRCTGMQLTKPRLNGTEYTIKLRHNSLSYYKYSLSVVGRTRDAVRFGIA